MGTEDATRPDHDEARQLLAAARESGSAVGAIPTPWWYFVATAALYAAIPLTQLLGDQWWIYLVAVMNMLVALNLVVARRAGVIGAATRNAGFTSTTLVTLVVLAASFLAYRETQQLWTVVVPAGVAAAMTLLGGWLYRRNPS